MSDWPGTDARYSFEFKSLFPCGFLIGFTPFGENVYPMGSKPGEFPMGNSLGFGFGTGTGNSERRELFHIFQRIEGGISARIWSRVLVQP